MIGKNLVFKSLSIQVDSAHFGLSQKAFFIKTSKNLLIQSAWFFIIDLLFSFFSIPEMMTPRSFCICWKSQKNQGLEEKQHPKSSLFSTSRQVLTLKAKRGQLLSCYMITLYCLSVVYGRLSRNTWLKRISYQNFYQLIGYPDPSLSTTLKLQLLKRRNHSLYDFSVGAASL